ncbi:MAG TPA: hypothetical protein VGY13_13665 [Solirubrobacteraceae bacterium]|nr:hypothetical protein [Solirubrobacteraceae bacterium]
MTLRAAALPLLLALCVALAACGKGGHVVETSAGTSTSSTEAGHASARPSPKAAPAGSPAVARARAFASAVNLQAADLPGFTVAGERKHKHGNGSEQRLERELHACAGDALAHSSSNASLAEAGSSTFERKGGIASQTISSSVTVERSPAAAAKLLEALRNTRLRGCLGHAFEGLLHTQRIPGATIGPATIKFGSPPAPGMTGGFGLRVRTTLVVRRIPIPFYLDVLGFVDGPAEVSFLAISIPAPLPAQLEEHLFSVLEERARAHSA